ncbi:MAG: hypothetical protein MUP30_11175 [Deltaproteobacteria bacterium]|nr:hypothetical protein [Deltaproteobacteria bacterium]
MVAVLYLALCLISLGILAFGVVMMKIAYDLHHPLEFLAVFFAASLVILIGASLAVGFGLRAFHRLKKIKKTP